MKVNTRWIDFLNDEDLAFLKRFVLAGGSLKDLASAYGISYPTVRLRLDRLIEKVKVVESQQSAGAFERMVQALYAEGKIDAAALKQLVEVHKQEMETNHAKPDAHRDDADRR